MPCRFFYRVSLRRGFSIIEMLVVIGITSVIMVTLSAAILGFYRSNSFALEQAVALNNARKGIEALTRDVREATYGDDGAFPIASIAPQTFIFYADVDADSGIERVRYFVDGATEMLNMGIVNAAGSPPVYSLASETVTLVAEDIRNIALATSTFRYYNESGVEITDFNNVIGVAHVRLNLIVNVNPATAPNDVALRGSATIRNLKTNL